MTTTQTPLLLADAYDSPLFNPEIDRKTGFTTKSMLTVPVVAGGRLVGVVQMINKHGGGVVRNIDKGMA